MVMVTRSAHRRACESVNSSGLSQKKTIPPWCSSGKIYDKRTLRNAASKWEIQSTYALRENIWEYLYENSDNFNCSSKRRNGKTHCKQQISNNKRRGKASLILVIFLFVTIGMMVSLWMINAMPKGELITMVIERAKLISLYVKHSTAVSEECCHKMRYLAAELSRAEQALRNTLRLRRNMMLTSQTKSVPNNYATQIIDSQYIVGAIASKGSDTMEWGGRMALWGIVPLWRAAPPPDTVLSLRRPTPSDCWPFSGSFGEIIVHLPHIQRVRCISVEHVRPDTARSAPKHFVVYGILGNTTWVKVLDGHYKNKGQAKQYYPLNTSAPLKSIIFQVLSNQGNFKYTCIYRIHLYGDIENLKLF